MKYLSNNPKPLRSTINNLIKRLGIESGIRQAKAIQIWDDIVGEINAKKTEVLRVERGILFIKVSDCAWRQELSMQKFDIIKRLNSALKSKIIRDIYFE